MFLLISTHFTATPEIPLPSIVLQISSIECHSQVEPGGFTPDLNIHLRALYAQSFRLTLAPSVLPRLLAQSLPVLFLQLTSTCLALNLASFLTDKSALQPSGLLHTRGIAGSGLPPLSNIPHCCLP